MAKGQRRSNREIRKPKKATAEKNAGPAASFMSSIFAEPLRSGAKAKKR